VSTEPADRDLLSRAAREPAAFEEFYRRHVDRVIGFAARRVKQPADVADLVASTFVVVLTSADSYDAKRGEPTAWLLGITSRLIANGQRRTGREAAAIARLAGRVHLEPSDIERLEDRIDASRTTRDLIDALDQLKPRAREALMLVGADGLTPSEGAAVLGISPPAFRMRLSAARRALTTAMGNADTTNSPQPERPPHDHRPTQGRPLRGATAPHHP
jgi:RNA polymerase sigma factor (sigma-70 family)